jgi:(R)-amidase
MIAALVQMFCKWGDIEYNLDRISHYCREAIAADAELVCFPELTVSGIYKDEEVWGIAEPLSGPSIQFLRGLARNGRLGIGAGFSEKAEGKPYNTYCVIDPGGDVAGVYRKNYIPNLEVPFWQGHTARPMFEFCGRKVGVAICWDNKYPELLEHYGQQGAQVVLMPHAWDSDAMDEEGKVMDYQSMQEIVAYHKKTGNYKWKTHDQMRDDFYTYIPQLAHNCRFCALFVNQAGRPHPSIEFVGPSFAVGSDGKVLVETRDGSEQMLIVELAV